MPDAMGMGAGIGRRVTMGSSPSNPRLNLGNLFSGFNATSSGGGSGSSGSSGPISNQSNNDPQQQAILAQILARANGDAGAGRAIDVAAGKIRESSIGASKEAEANRVRRGVSGSGIEGYDQKKISDATQRAIAGSASDIASAAEDKKSQLLASAAGVAGNLASQNLQDRSLALQQWQQQEQNRIAQQQMQTQMQMAQMQMLASLANL
jgi:hypothetical protein